MADLKPSETTAKVLAYSVNERDQELTTVVATFARSALAEVNTHRVFSRNSASSRAIPVAKMLEQVQNNPFIPRRISLAQKGMHTDSFVDYAVDPDEWQKHAEIWLDIRDHAVKGVNRLLDLGWHKQDANRILEPFLLHTAIISTTTWDNFYDLRLALNEKGNPLAYPPIYDLALAIKNAIQAEYEGEGPQYMYVPTPFNEGGNVQWHLPLIGFPGDEELSTLEKCKVSAARCARVSYLTHSGVRDVEADLRLFDTLLGNGHWSPLEHVAHPDDVGSGNFKGWKQLRYYAEAGWL